MIPTLTAVPSSMPERIYFQLSNPILLRIPFPLYILSN